MLTIWGYLGGQASGRPPRRKSRYGKTRFFEGGVELYVATIWGRLPLWDGRLVAPVSGGILGVRAARGRMDSMFKGGR